MDLTGPLQSMQQRFERVQHDLSLPETAANPPLLQQLSREHARLAPVIQKFHRYKKCLSEREDLGALLQSGDGELRRLAADDMASLTAEIEMLEKDLQIAVLPKDPNEDRNA